MGLTTNQIIELTASGVQASLREFRTKPVPSIIKQTFTAQELLAYQFGFSRAVSPKLNAVLHYSIVGGTHSEFFNINPTNGALALRTIRDPGDLQVIVRVRDTSENTFRDAEIRVKIKEDPNGGGTGVITVDKEIELDEGAAEPFIFLTGSGISSWGIDGGPDADAVRVVNGYVEFKTPPIFNSPHDLDEDNVYQFRVVAYNGLNEPIAARNITINIQDVTSDPYVHNQQEFSILVSYPIGTVVGTVQADVDPDRTAQDFAITGGPGASLFAINPTTGVITIAASLFGADELAPVFVTVGDGTNTSAPTEVLIEIVAQSQISIEPSSVLHQPVMENVAAINCGGPTYFHSDGTVYTADAYFTSGTSYTTTEPISGTVDDELYQSERFGSSFWYDIPVPGPGLYRVTLHLAEIYMTTQGQREFTVRFENGNVGDYTTGVIDIIEGAGAKAAYDFVREVYVDGTNLDLDFNSITNFAKVSGIRVDRVVGEAITKNEGNSGTTNFSFNVIRGGVTSSGSTVDWQVIGSGAHPVSANDFVGGVLPSGTVSFAAGELIKQIVIPIQGDMVSESSESFEIKLSNPDIASVIIKDTASATVTDEDFNGPTYRYFMVDTTEDTVLTELSEGQTIPFTLVSGRNISIYATAANITVGSARLQLDGGTIRTESTPPYVLYGDIDDGEGGIDYLTGQPITVGAHTLNVTWYSGIGGTGSVLETTALNFTVASSTGNVTLVNTNSIEPIEMGEMHPIGSRLPMIFEIQNAPAGVYWSEWTMASDPDDMFEAVSHGVILKRQLDHSFKTSHNGVVRVIMRDGTTGDFPFTLTVIPFTGTTYYVALTGSDSNPGTGVSPFRTLSKACSVVAAGDLVYVKAGNYGNATLPLTANGTFAQPIVFSGYQTVPGDDPHYEVWDADNDTPNTSLMPCIDRGTRDNDDYGLLAGGTHCFVTNFTSSNWNIGAYATRNWTGFYRVYTREHGRTDVQYSGKGLTTMGSADFVSFADCHAVNANAQAITVSEHCVVVDCGAYCDNNDTYAFSQAAATDYYIICGADYATVRRSVVRRHLNVTTHNGHGIETKAGAHCLFEDIESINAGGGTGFRHAEASYGVMRRFTITGDNGIMIRDGAHDCLVEDGTVTDAYLGIWFYESTEGEAGNPQNYSAWNNTIRNVTVTGCSYAVATRNTFDQAGCLAKGNTLEDLTINNCVYLFLLTHGYDTDNILKDSTLTQVTNYQNFWSGSGMGPSNNGFQFSGNTLVNCGFTLPT